ncbi:MAG TPA: riboflavin synthase [Nitrospina sp.]|jgi:riboflavin synthase|nr:riboflavin synthase [Nitrospinaceae bacterium]HCK69897.1 riboflavin synthase [Nitrospina sp.]|tara:strand:- start:193 stop:834 length:642 start_codon:yes stop_codon:yes gene_type:complete
MFSGIVLSVGTIGEYIQKNEGAVLVVNTDLSGFEDGESIAVNGVCLTVVDSTETTFKLDLSTETLSRTNFKNAKKGDRINLERSLTPSTKISGHFVSGHIDQVGEIVDIEEKPGEVLFRFSHPAKLSPFIMEKGSIAIDGISLTVFDCKDNRFTVSIIPFTLSHTNLSSRKIGDLINIECDMIGKYVFKACETLLNPNEKKPSLDFLRQQGFA